MNPIAFNKKFKDLNKFELLEVVNFFVESNSYNCTEEYITFEDYNMGTHYSGSFEKQDVVNYFENNYFELHKLKGFYKGWN